MRRGYSRYRKVRTVGLISTTAMSEAISGICIRFSSSWN